MSLSIFDTEDKNDLEEFVYQFTKDAICRYLDKWVDREPSYHCIVTPIFPTERRIHAIIQGLITSLGLNVWEDIAKNVADKSGFEILDSHSFRKPRTFPAKVQRLISSFHERRTRRKNPLALDEYKTAIDELVDQYEGTVELVPLDAGDGIDLWIRKGNIEYAFDSKTVQINKSGGNNFDLKLITWYAARQFLHPKIKFSPAIAIPYSPWPDFTVESWINKQKSRIYPLIVGQDILVQDQYWQLLSGGSDAWDIIQTAFLRIREDNLLARYHHLFSA